MTRPQTALAYAMTALFLLVASAQWGIYQARQGYQQGFDEGYSAGIEANQN